MNGINFDHGFSRRVDFCVGLAALAVMFVAGIMAVRAVALFF